MNKKTPAKKSQESSSPSAPIDARIKELNDWRGETLARARDIIRKADPEIVETVKWRKPVFVRTATSKVPKKRNNGAATSAGKKFSST